MQCDLCGKEEELYSTRIEGTEMQVCSKCTRFGEVLKKRIVKVVEQKPSHRAAEVVLESVVPEYSTLIRNARAQKGLTQEEFAKILNVKESMLHNMESGKQKPDIALARKLEKALHIKLVENFKDEEMKKEPVKSDGFTLGDFIKKK